MPHADDGQLNALLDGELPAAEAREVQAHLAGCTECARRLEEARSFLAEAGELLAVLVPGAPSAPVAVPAPPAAALPPAALVPPSATRQEELPFIAPRARGPADSDSTRKLDRDTGPRLQPTAKEVAVSVDGRTEMTPAIRPVTRTLEPKAPRKPWRVPELEKLAWAASLVLCLGVGYLANEVKNLNREKDSLAALQTREIASPAAAEAGDAAPAAPAAQPRRPTATTGPARQTSSRDEARRNPASGSRTVRPGDGSLAGASQATKPPNAVASKPPAPFAQQRPADGLASGGMPSVTGSGAAPGPTSGVGLADRAGAPPPASRPADAAASDAARSRSSRTAAPAAPAAPTPGEALGSLERRMQPATNALEEAPVTAPAAFRRITIEDAVRRLSGTIRLIDGMQPTRVEAGPGRLVTGANPERDVVRVTYMGSGTRLVLDQQVGDVRTGSFNGLMQGDTLVTATDGGGTRVRWVDRKFWLSLTGALETDSLRALVGRVR